MIRFEDVSVSFSTPEGIKEVLRHVSVRFTEKKITALLGPSGSGKTTCLQLISGLLSPTSGNVYCETSDLGNVSYETPSISYLFQDLALFPWLSAIENVNLVLSDHKETLPLAEEKLRQVELGDALTCYPEELSGGMKQRLALARSLATDADILLLDEPFRGLDDSLHARMRDLLVRERRGKTTVFVTHDLTDTKIADEVFYIENGSIREFKGDFEGI